MPVIREYQSQVAPEGIIRTSATPEDFGAGIGAGLGQGLGDIADHLFAASDKKKREADALDLATERVNADIAVKEMIAATSSLDRSQLDEIAANPNDEETIRNNYKVQRDEFVRDYTSQLKFDENKLFVTASMAEARVRQDAKRADDIAQQKTNTLMDALSRQANAGDKAVSANPLTWQDELDAFIALADAIKAALPELNAEGAKVFNNLIDERREQLKFNAAKSLVISNPQVAHRYFRGIEPINMDVPFGRRSVKMPDGSVVDFTAKGTLAENLAEGSGFGRSFGAKQDVLQHIKAQIVADERKKQFKPIAGLEWINDLTLENQSKLKALAKSEANIDRAVAQDTLKRATDDATTAAGRGEKFTPVTRAMFSAAITNPELAERAYGDHQLQVQAATISHEIKLLTPEEALIAVDEITQSVQGLGHGAAILLKEAVWENYIKQRQEAIKDPADFGVTSKKIDPLPDYGVKSLTTRAAQVSSLNGASGLQGGVFSKSEATAWKEIFGKANTAEQANMLTTLSAALDAAKVDANIRSRTIAQVGVDFPMQTALSLLTQKQTGTALAILQGRSFLNQSTDPSGNKVSIPSGLAASDSEVKTIFDKEMLKSAPMSAEMSANAWNSVYAYILGKNGPQALMGATDKKQIIRNAIKSVFGDSFEHNDRNVFVPFGVRPEAAKYSMMAGYGNLRKADPSLPPFVHIVLENIDGKTVQAFSEVTGDPVLGQDGKPILMTFGKVEQFEKGIADRAKQHKQDLDKKDMAVRLNAVAGFEDAMRAKVKSTSAIGSAIDNAAVHEKWYRKNNENGQYNRILDAINNRDKYARGHISTGRIKGLP